MQSATSPEVGERESHAETQSQPGTQSAWDTVRLELCLVALAQIEILGVMYVEVQHEEQRRPVQLLDRFGVRFRARAWVVPHALRALYALHAQRALHALDTLWASPTEPCRGDRGHSCRASLIRASRP